MQKFTERGVPMAYSNAKGLIALPTDYSQSNGYTFAKLSYKFIQPNGNITITPNQIIDICNHWKGEETKQFKNTDLIYNYNEINSKYKNMDFYALI